MTYFVVRYDFRCPDGPDGESPDGAAPGASRHERYRASLDQVAWCEDAGFDSVVLSEHHGVDDGYLPSPVTMAAAFGARTTRIPIVVAALLANLHEPLRLAEDIAVVDHVSGGRVGYVFGLGYRKAEYEMFAEPWKGRGEALEATIRTLLAAWRGEPFEHEGRTVSVTPAPFSRPHPLLFYGGGSPVAARRAARLGLGFYPQSPDTSLAEVYRAECERLGVPPGLVMQPPPGPGCVFCTRDPDRFWEQQGERLLYDASTYAEWQRGNESLVFDDSSSVEELRAAGVYVAWTPEELIERCRSGEVQLVTAHPMCGGVDPEVGWESLRLIGDVVIPALRG